MTPLACMVATMLQVAMLSVAAWLVGGALVPLSGWDQGTTAIVLLLVTWGPGRMLCSIVQGPRQAP